MIRSARGIGAASSLDRSASAVAFAALLASACGSRVSLGLVPGSDASAGTPFAADSGGLDSSLPDAAGSAPDVGSSDGDASISVPDAASGDAGSEGASDAGTLTADGADATPDSGASNVITGSADGTRSFTTVSAAWWIQYPDPRVDGGPIVSTIVYLFSKPVTCDKLTVVKWDQNAEPGDTQDMEIEMAWSGASAPVSPPSVDFPVVALGGKSIPPPGMASTSYHLTPQQPPGAPSEIIASGGTVVLTSLKPNLDVAGTFHVAFPGGGSLVGSFDAAFCPNGREP